MGIQLKRMEGKLRTVDLIIEVYFYMFSLCIHDQIMS